MIGRVAEAAGRILRLLLLGLAWLFQPRVVATAAICTGVAHFCWPASFIVFGLLLLLFDWRS